MSTTATPSAGPDHASAGLGGVAFQTGPQSPLWPKGEPADIAVRNGNLAESLEISARRWPERPALLYYGTTTTYRSLLAEVEALAAWLAAFGLKPGERVILDLQNGPQFVIAFYAVLRSGGVVVPVNPMNTGEELAWIAQDSGARLAIAAEDLLDRFADTGLALLRVRYADRVDPRTADPLPAVMTAPPAAGPAAPSFEAAIAAGRALPLPAMPPGGETLAILPYTSGTTGRPKACITPHSAAWFVAEAQARWYGTDHRSVMTSFMPLFHVAGMMASMASAICAGAAMVLMTRWDADAVPALLRRHEVTWWSAAPTMIVDVLASGNFTDDCFAALKVLTGGGSSMPAPLAERLFQTWGLRFCEGYGLTETISATHINPLAHPKPQCLGLPIHNTHALIVDPDTLAPLPQGTLGEVLLSGPQVMRGYWNRPDATAETLVTLGGRTWLRSGDLGYVDDEGFYFIVDRIKRMINVAGYKVWPAECEMLLYRHPAVQEIAVISAPHPRRGETVRAVIALKQEFRGKVTAEDITGFARTVLAAYKVPQQIEFRDALPRSGTRKIDWRRLQQEAWGAAP